MPDADLSSALDAIRKRAHAASRAKPSAGPTVAELASAADVPRLLAAVTDLLALHQPGVVVILGDLCKQHENHRFFSITATEAAGVRDCPDCQATVYNACTGCPSPSRLDRCHARQAIARALLGEEATDGDQR
jgi:hypothetical protein